MQKIPQKNAKNLRIVAFGDIVGSAGRAVIKQLVPEIKQHWHPDLIIANAENASHGYGLTPKHAIEIHNAGIDLMTMGNHTWDKHILWYTIKKFPYIARPLNQTRETPGQGYAVYETKFGNFAVISLVGRFFMNPANCPFHAVFDTIKDLHKQGIKMIAVDIHAEASAEKQIMGYFLDGKASIVWGTHTHVQTADEHILPKGTGYMTDLGMTGASESVLGFEIEPALKKMIYGEPNRMHPATKGPLMATGLIADIDPSSGKTKFIMRFKEKLDPIPDLVEENAEKDHIIRTDMKKEAEL